MDIGSLVEVKPKIEIPAVRAGDTVKVAMKVIEGEKERAQAFEGMVIRARHSGPGASITLRKVFQGVGVERTFPLNSPRLEKVEIIRQGKVRRAKLYYLRRLSGKEARLKVKTKRKDEVR